MLDRIGLVDYLFEIYLGSNFAIGNYSLTLHCPDSRASQSDIEEYTYILVFHICYKILLKLLCYLELPLVFTFEFRAVSKFLIFKMLLRDNVVA